MLSSVPAQWVGHHPESRGMHAAPHCASRRCLVHAQLLQQNAAPVQLTHRRTSVPVVRSHSTRSCCPFCHRNRTRLSPTAGVSRPGWLPRVALPVSSAASRKGASPPRVDAASVAAAHERRCSCGIVVGNALQVTRPPGPDMPALSHLMHRPRARSHAAQLQAQHLRARRRTWRVSPLQAALNAVFLPLAARHGLHVGQFWRRRCRAALGGHVRGAVQGAGDGDDGVAVARLRHPAWHMSGGVGSPAMPYTTALAGFQRSAERKLRASLRPLPGLGALR